MKKGDVCLIDFNLGVGNEQYGERPAILISDTKTKIVVVIPFTSNLEALRFPYTLVISPSVKNNLKQKSIALIFHIRSIDKIRIIKTIGKIDLKFQKEIDGILKRMLGL